jgi:hypothetical protein
MIVPEPAFAVTQDLPALHLGERCVLRGLRCAVLGIGGFLPVRERPPVPAGGRHDQPSALGSRRRPSHRPAAQLIHIDADASMLAEPMAAWEREQLAADARSSPTSDAYPASRPC